MKNREQHQISDRDAKQGCDDGAADHCVSGIWGETDSQEGGLQVTQ